MSSDLLPLDSAMNMIKEELLRDLSDSVMKTSKDRKSLFKEVSFSEKYTD